METGSASSSSSSRRRLAFWLFAVFQFFYLLTSTGRVRTPDEYNTFYTVESLALRGSTAVPQAVELHNFYGRYDLRGQPRAAYPPGQALLCAPWYAFGQHVLARLRGVPADDTDLVVAFSSCLSSATFSALTVMFFFLLLAGIGIPLCASALATAMLGLGTPIFAYSGWLFSEPLSSAIFMGVALLLFGRGYDPIPLSRAASGGSGSRAGDDCPSDERSGNCRVHCCRSGTRWQTRAALGFCSMRDLGNRSAGSVCS